MIWSAIGAALMALGVMLGAFGAHALKDRLDAYSLASIAMDCRIGEMEAVEKGVHCLVSKALWVKR